MHPRTLARRLQSVVTGSDGRYRVVQLQPGPYQVAAELQGFSTSWRNVALVVGNDAELDISLGVAALSENVTVTGRGDVRNQLDVINAYRATLNLPAFARDRLRMRAPAKNLDVRLTKRVNLSQSRRVELFAEAFNVTNVVNVTGG